MLCDEVWTVSTLEYRSCVTTFDNEEEGYRLHRNIIEQGVLGTKYCNRDFVHSHCLSCVLYGGDWFSDHLLSFCMSDAKVVLCLDHTYYEHLNGSFMPGRVIIPENDFSLLHKT